jgi:uncharacterized protein
MRALLDTNLWIALSIETHPQHATARAWYEATPLEAGGLLFCRVTEISFLRLLTQPAVMNPCGLEAMTNDEAIDHLSRMRSDTGVGYLEESSRALWLRLARHSLPSPNRWMDAYLSALAIEAALQFATYDRGFRQFESLGLPLNLLEIK